MDQCVQYTKQKQQMQETGQTTDQVVQYLISEAERDNNHELANWIRQKKQEYLGG